MIVIFGPAGAGKSVQGQLLAARMGWRWLSAGQLIRDSKDPELLATIQGGNLAPHDKIVKIMGDAIAKAADVDHIILDGFPRMFEQAKWLIDSQPEHGRSVGLVIVLDVPREELLKRLAIRGRPDDEPEAIDKRFELYKQETEPVIDYFETQQIPIVHIDGLGAVDQVHDRIVEAISSHGLV